MTQHFKSHYIIVTVNDVLRLCTNANEYALINTQTNEYAKVPLFIANEWRGNHFITTRGPFVFHDGFVETEEAQYLLKMLQYTTLTSRAERKVEDIRRQFSDWIGYDDEVRGYLKHNIQWL